MTRCSFCKRAGSSQIQLFEASSNQISGTLPRSLGALGSLIELSLADNLLTGTLPAIAPGQLVHALRAPWPEVAHYAPTMYFHPVPRGYAITCARDTIAKSCLGRVRKSHSRLYFIDISM